jgi:LmbE family N-acetylglucosaminyl deacetylase
MPFANNLLVIAPHTDDAELGCGGTIARLLEEGTMVHVAVFSSAEDSLPVGAAPGTLLDEFERAMDVLAIPEAQRHVFDYKVRQMTEQRQSILEALLHLRADVRPDMVLVPSGNDLHQDHRVIHAEARRAFKEVTLWGYELPWNHSTFSTQAFVRIEQRHLDLKWRALQQYKTQIQLKRAYFTRNFIDGLACVRGAQIKVDYAEAFDVVRVSV